MAGAKKRPQSQAPRSGSSPNTALDRLGILASAAVTHLPSAANVDSKPPKKRKSVSSASKRKPKSKQTANQKAPARPGTAEPKPEDPAPVSERPLLSVTIPGLPSAGMPGLVVPLQRAARPRLLTRARDNESSTLADEEIAGLVQTGTSPEPGAWADMFLQMGTCPPVDANS